jgi:shikimate dehydrogenase
MKLFGLIGFPLTHSFSKTYFQEKFFKEERGDCLFENFELKAVDEITEVLQQNPYLKGFAITIPYKKNILPFLYWMSAEVQQMQACNCVKIIDGKLYGYNTDIIGFEQSLKQKLLPQHRKALILGSGGAANAVEYVLQKMGIAYLIVSRKSKPEQSIIAYEDLNETIIKEHPLIINATPLGTYPKIDEYPNIPYQYVTANHYLFDLVYNPAVTKFLALGMRAGATTKNGYDMLTIQAEENWKIWNTNLLIE